MITLIVMILSALYMIWMSLRVVTYTAWATFTYQVIPLLLSVSLIIICVIDNFEFIKGHV